MKAVITIAGTQGMMESGNDTVELVTDGIYTKTGRGYAIKYLESELTGLEGTTTTVEINDDDSVTVERRGTLNVVMAFRKGEKSNFLYDTQFGSATLGFDTRNIIAKFNDRGGELLIDYVVNMEHAVVSRNMLRMSVRPTKS